MNQKASSIPISGSSDFLEIKSAIANKRLRTPESIVKEIQSLDLAELTILCRNIALLIRSILEESDDFSVDDISEEFSEWLNSLSSYELLLVQTGILYRLEQAIANQEKKP